MDQPLLCQPPRADPGSPCWAVSLSRGSWVFIAPYIVHRDVRLFPNPEVFDPDRFAPGRIDKLPPYVFIPFGGGPRICTGNKLALTQIVLLAATVLQRFRIVLDQAPPEIELGILLRPKGALRMCALARSNRATPPRVARTDCDRVE
jgi:cytochrome P450